MHTEMQRILANGLEGLFRKQHEDVLRSEADYLDSQHAYEKDMRINAENPDPLRHKALQQARLYLAKNTQEFEALLTELGITSLRSREDFRWFLTNGTEQWFLNFVVRRDQLLIAFRDLGEALPPVRTATIEFGLHVQAGELDEMRLVEADRLWRKFPYFQIRSSIREILANGHRQGERLHPAVKDLFDMLNTRALRVKFAETHDLYIGVF